MFLFKIIRRPVDIFFEKYFSFTTLVYNIRGHSWILSDKLSREDYMRFFCNKFVNVWNGLPASIELLISFNKFKVALNIHIGITVEAFYVFIYLYEHFSSEINNLIFFSCLTYSNFSAVKKWSGHCYFNVVLFVVRASWNANI